LLAHAKLLSSLGLNAVYGALVSAPVILPVNSTRAHAADAPKILKDQWNSLVAPRCWANWLSDEPQPRCRTPGIHTCSPQMSPDFMRTGFRDSGLVQVILRWKRFVRRAAAECKVESTAAKAVESELSP